MTTVRLQLVVVLLGTTVMGQETRSASNACSTRAIVTAAGVTVSDGSSFRTESFFQHADAAAIRHVHEDGIAQTVAVEGPLAWLARGERARLGGAFEHGFALGHQYHAFLLHFDDIATQTARVESVEFDGAPRTALAGGYPPGGRVYLIDGERGDRPRGLLFEIEGVPAISAYFQDWRGDQLSALPWRIRIDDGTAVFDYRYTEIATHDRAADWFFAAVPPAPLDELGIYRLHRRLMAAHCAGDAAGIAALSAPETTVASNGQLQTVTREATEARFSGVFERLEYTHYSDLRSPRITVSDDGSIGWIAANVRTAGLARPSGASFDDQWAWIMTVRRIEGEWRHTANASSRRVADR